MKRVILSLGILTCIIFSCEETQNDAEVTPALLLDAWTHSMEEQEDANSTIRIFRPSGSREFVASRFRDAYEFKADDVCRYMFLHPADAHSMKDGTYTYNIEKGTIRIFSEDGDFLKEFIIRELSEDLLIMELTEPG